MVETGRAVMWNGTRFAVWLKTETVHAGSTGKEAKGYKMKWIIFVVAVLMVACTSSQRSDEVLKKSGFHDIQIGGYGWFACGEDLFKTKFTATNVNGEKVEGTVCCGILKSCTVRF